MLWLVLSVPCSCADCGAKLYQVRGRSLPQSEYMVCATYRKKGKEVCPSHQIRNCVLEELLLDGIRIVWNCIGEFMPPMPQKEEETA